MQNRKSDFVPMFSGDFNFDGTGILMSGLKNE